MTKVWNCGEGELRRFNPRGPPYHISNERYLSSTHGDMNRHSSRSYDLPSHDNRHDEQDEEQETGKGVPRRRIPVACNRCRKRKIRCSGPTPGDGSCGNCKGAGNDNCQFNRVQSSELPFIGRENAQEYVYDTFAARNIQCRTMNQNNYGLTPNYATGSANVPGAYRVPVADCQYSSKSSYIPAWIPEYGDEGDYDLSGSYSHIGPEQVGIPAGYSAQPARGWTPAPQIAKASSNGLYYDAEWGTHYNQSQVSYQNQAYNLRPSVSVESNFSLSGMASSLPTSSPLASNDRVVLPVPGTRAGQAIVTLPRSSEGMAYPPKTGINSLIPSSISFLQPLSTSTENTQPYNSTVLSTSLPHPHQDIYNTPSSDSWSPHEQTLRSQHSLSEMYSYGPSSNNSRKASQSSQNNITATVPNGQMYISYPASDEIVRRTSMDISHTATHRPSNSSLRAA